jgi:hypothetical protein
MLYISFILTFIFLLFNENKKTNIFSLLKYQLILSLNALGNSTENWSYVKGTYYVNILHYVDSEVPSHYLCFTI